MVNTQSKMSSGKPETGVGNVLLYFPQTAPDTIEYEYGEIETYNILFVINESIKFNDGNGINDTETYLGPVLHDDILEHKIRQSDDA